MLEEILHEFDVIRIRTVRLDVDDNPIVLGPRKALAIIVAGDTEDLLARQAGRFERAVHGVHQRAGQFRGEADSLGDILHTESRAVRSHHWIGTIDFERPPGPICRGTSGWHAGWIGGKRRDHNPRWR